MVRAQRLSIVHFASFDLRHSMVLQSIIDYTAIIIHKFVNVESCVLPRSVTVFIRTSTLSASEDSNHDQDA
jgi:hypothetical protein